MRTTACILTLLTILTLAGCSSSDSPSGPSSMTVRLQVETNPLGCAAGVSWASTPDAISGQMLGMTQGETTAPEIVPAGTTITVQGNISCAVPGSSGGIDAIVQVMVNGNWQDAPMSGTRTCNVAQGPGGCVIGFTSNLS